MATNIWLGGTSSAWGTGANWSAGSAPSNGDDIAVTGGTNGIAGSDQSALAPGSFRVLAPFDKSIGSTSALLQTGNFTANTGVIEIDVNGPATQEICLDPGNVASAVIRNTGPGANACYLEGGTYTDLVILGGQSVRLGPTLVATNVIVDIPSGQTPPRIYIESGATITNLFINNCEVRSEAAVPNVRTTASGYYFWVGSGSTYNHTLLEGEGRFYLWGVGGGTIAAVDIKGSTALVETSRATVGWTFTNGKAANGARILLRPGIDVPTNPMKSFASMVIGGNAYDIGVPK